MLTSHPSVQEYIEPENVRRFTQRVLRDLRALAQIIEDGLIETGVRRLGVEQELVLVDRAWLPAPLNMQVLEAIDDPHFTTELARFNLEVNLDPIKFGPDCLGHLEVALNKRVDAAREAAGKVGADVVLTGILPTIRQTDLDIRNISPVLRYHVLNAAIKAIRGSAFELHLAGLDGVNIKNESVMLEACNTSFQMHFQVAPDEFAKLYNIAQVATGPLLAASCNSPLLFGRRLWRETRIAVFEQSIDTRLPAHYIQERSPRVSFGNRWVNQSILEIYEEDLSRFRAFMSMEVDEDPTEELAQGRLPHLRALAFHNGTIYRWNRPCYGIHDGTAHLRIENRVLPSGPTIIDQVANAAFWYGLINGLAHEHEDITKVIEFDAAKANFLAAAQLGLDAQLHWLDGSKHAAPALIARLIPLAGRGLEAIGVESSNVNRYLSLVEERVASGQTGAEWQIRSFERMQNHGTRFQRRRALAAAMRAREEEGEPVHRWKLASLSEAGGWMEDYQHVAQYMTMDVFAVHKDEVIDLVANVMAWRNIRHVPVEDDEHRLVGMVSYRLLLSYIAKSMPDPMHDPVAVGDIMARNPPVISPDTPTLEAIQIMRDRGVSCLPVVQSDRIVGIVTEHDFMNIAARLLGESMEAIVLEEPIEASDEMA